MLVSGPDCSRLAGLVGQPKRDDVSKPGLFEQQKATKTATWSIMCWAGWYYDRHGRSQHARIVWEQRTAFLSEMPPCWVCSLTRNHEHIKIRQTAPSCRLVGPCRQWLLQLTRTAKDLPQATGLATASWYRFGYQTPVPSPQLGHLSPQCFILLQEQ